MEVAALLGDGAWTVTPRQHGDQRGAFLEWFRADLLAQAVGWAPVTMQANLSRSRRGVVRGVHFTDVPPGQSKYVTCVAGAVLDVVVDLRTGSPTFGRCATVRLDDQDRRAVFVAEGMGHAFQALTDPADVVYLCSTPYAPAREHEVHPLDPSLGIPWAGDVEPVLSAKDAAAPTLAAAQAAGALPDYLGCVRWYAEAPNMARTTRQ